MHGFNGKILRVDLTRGKTAVEAPGEEEYRKHLGGRGFIVPVLLRDMGKGIDPLGPDNRLVFALGPLTGHPLIGSGRNSVGCKSPLTGGYGESEAGGFWGAELKKAGFDAIVLEGCAEAPVYIRIADGEVEIRKAGHLWGKPVADTHREIARELGDPKIRTTAIGQAGENRVGFACILNDITHAAGRTGIGAVMGAKRVKAIAVRGTRLPPMADRAGILRLNRWMVENFREKNRHWRYGTGSTIEEYEANGNLPIRNFSGGRFPGVSKITPQRLCAEYLVKMDGCHACPIRCKRVVRLETPWRVDPVYGGPEYETLAALGANCGIDDLEALMKGNELCNMYGLDTISTGVTVSFAMECFEKGILTSRDTDGLEPTFGNSRAMLELIDQIAFRKGFGDLLADGTRSAAEKIGRGAPELAMQVKGTEIPMHEPRHKKTLAVHYSIHAGGADHGTGPHETALDEATAEVLYRKGFPAQLANTVGLCRFVPWSDEHVEAALEAVTGWKLPRAELEQVVDRGITLTRIFNLREGFTEKEDRLPRRFTEPTKEGTLAGIDPVKLESAQREYYRLLGWDEKGVPTRARLAELGIAWAGRFIPTKIR